MSSPVSEPQGEPSGLGDEESLSVLLVEDNPGDARLFEEYLSESPVEVDVRHEKTLRACIEALGEEEPDVLVADLGLPDSEGAETVKAAAAAAPEVPIVVLTGDGNLQAALQAQEAGAAEYLQKDELTPALTGRTLRWALRQSQMQEKLRQRDAWVRSITEGLSAGVFRAGPTGRIEYANEALARLLGFDQAEGLVGRDLTEFYADATDRGRMLAEEGAEGVEVGFVREDGTTFAGLISAKVAYDGEGRPVHYDGTITDITDRKDAERELAETKARYESLVEDVFDSSPVGVFILNESFEVVWVNEATETFFGIDRRDIVGMDKRRLIEEEIKDKLDDPEAFAGAVEATYEDNSYVEQFECHVLPGAGREERWLEHQSRPIDRGRYEGGRVELYTDITTQKEREQDLRVLSEAVQQAKEAVLITEGEPLGEPGPRIEYVNRACEEMTGWAEGEIVGKTPRVLQGPETEREVLDSLREALEAGEEWQGETVNYRKDGEPYRVQWNVAPVTSGAGEIEHWVSVQRDVTEKRAREERLALMAQALEQVGEKVVITDRDGTIEYVNEAFEEMTGYSEEEAVGKTPRVLQSGEQGDAFYEELWDTITDGEPFRAEFINEKKGGATYVEDEIISPVRGKEGAITHFVSVGRDVTEKRAREEQLRRQKALLEQAQRLAGAWEVDLQSGVLSWSEEVYRIHEIEPGTDLSVEEAIEFFTPEARPRIEKAFERCIAEGEPYDLELPLVTAEGNRRWVRTVGAPAKEEKGEVVKVAGALQDITDRKTEEKRRQQVIERVTDAIVEVDSGWRFTLVNEQAEALYDMREEDLLGRNFWDVFEGALGTRFEEEYRGVMQSREPTRFEEYYPGLDAWFDVQVYPNEDGGLAFYFEEITERKERERELREAKEEAERMNRLKSAFLANMSHEIRTPLTSILGFAEAIGEESRGADSAEEVDLPVLTRFSALIEKSGRRLMETLTGVLNLSKLEAGEMDLSVETVDLAAEARETVEEFQPRAKEAGVDLTVTTEEEVWARADEGGLHIVLQNLISNGIKYTEAGGEVQVRVRAGENLAFLEVEDTGIGMDPEKTSELFEAFKQESEGIGREYEGSGLGLALVKELLGRMNGSVEVDTEKGVGSCFTVRLPRPDEAAGEA